MGIQAGLDQRRLAGAARTGQQHVVGGLALHKLLGIALDLFLLPIDLLAGRSAAWRRHGAPAPARRHARCCACGSARRCAAPQSGADSGWGSTASMRLHQLLGALQQVFEFSFIWPVEIAYW
jgi:hypothetical protein